VSDMDGAPTGSNELGPPEQAVREFVTAIAWGEHRTVWRLFGDEARSTVLKVASKRGMEDDLVARLRDGTASEDEYDEFLADLISGLRADLAGNDLDALEYETDTVPPAPDQARVVLNVPLPFPLEGSLPMGSVELTVQDGGWRVVRLVPQVTK